MSLDLSTQYLGLTLKNPVVVGACPLSEDIDVVKRLADAGAAAIVMNSLFEEQVTAEQLGAFLHVGDEVYSHPEASSYLPQTEVFAQGPERYLERIRALRQAADLPVIASLNGVSPGGWTSFAQHMEQAGASALELNLYGLPTNPEEDAATVERRALEVVREVRAAVKLPLAVKLSPFYSSLPHFVTQLEAAGASAVVLFNRFYQPDIDIEELAVQPTLHLSTPEELTLRLRWLAIVSPTAGVDLACSGGVHGPLDAIKALMAGAKVVQVVSALLKRGPSAVTEIVDGLAGWLKEHEYESLAQMQGSMNMSRCPDPSAYERVNYMALLRTWQRPADWGR